MMIYYRIAFQRNQEPIWQWKSTVLSELSTVFQWLRLHRALPHDLLRVFSCSSREKLNKQLAQENQGQASPSVTAAQFLRERRISSQEGAEERQYIGREGTRQGHPCQSIIEREQPGSTYPQYARKDMASMSFAEPNKSVTSAYALAARGISVLENWREALERGSGGDHDLPYTFALPATWPQVLAWIKLLAKVHTGELQP